MQRGKSKQPKDKTPKNSRQDADPPARFASHHQKNSEANSERGRSPTETTTTDLPRTQWKKTTVSQQIQKRAAKISATQWSETHDLRCCQEDNKKSHFLHTIA